MYGIDKVPPSVSDAQLAALLQPYLGTLPIAPFTLNMKLDPRDKVLGFLNIIYPGINSQQNSQPSETQTGDIAQSLQNLLSAAQTPQLAVDGEPAPIPPNSGGLARNTASTLGSIIASLQDAFTAASLTWPPTVPASIDVAAAITSWGQQTANQTLVSAALAQLNQDVPVKTVQIDVAGTSGATTTLTKTILLNQSLQEVLETEYVAKGSAIIFGGLQSLVNQQDDARVGVGLLSNLQTVYNGIQPTALPTSIGTAFKTDGTSVTAIKQALANDLASKINYFGIVVRPTGGGIINIGPANGVNFNVIPPSVIENYISVTATSISVNFRDLYINQTGNDPGFAATISQTFGSSHLWEASGGTVTLQNAVSTDITNDLISVLLTNSSFFSASDSIDVFLNSLDAGDPAKYVSDLVNVLPNIFPKPGASVVNNIQINGQALTLTAGGTMQQLLNGLYQSYLQQAAQRLIAAANANTPTIIVDPNFSVDPNTGSTQLFLTSAAASDTAAQAKLQVIQSLQAYAYNIKTPSGTGSQSNNITIASSTSASIPLIVDIYDAKGNQYPSAIGDVTLAAFGGAEGGSFEDNLRKTLQNLVGGVALLGGNVDELGYLVVDNSGNIDVTRWILGNWPTGKSDTPRIPGAGLDQTQSILTNAFSSATSLNDSLQQQLKQSFFLFQQFIQSATSALSGINKIITKMAQNISNR